MKFFITTLITAFTATTSMAQDSTVEQPKLSWSVFADVYYSYDFNQPSNHEKASFLYNHKRHNEVNLNLALVQASYQSNRLRGNIGLQVGTYPEYNYAAEQGLLKNVYQANIGVKLSTKNNLWIDAGIFPSHIGYESAVSKDNWTLTRSLMSENSPFYESGAKLSYISPNEKWFVSGMVLNGWQRIRRIDGNNTPAFGTQLTYTPNEKATFNWSTFVGNEYPDSIKKWRYFNNLYAILKPSEKFGITVGFDIGVEQKARGSSEMNPWYTPNVVLRYALNNNWAIAARGEYYSDENGVIIPIAIGTGTTNGFQTFGGSLNVDRKIDDNFWWRTELRTLHSKDAIFIKEGNQVKGNTFITTSFAIAF